MSSDNPEITPSKASFESIPGDYTYQIALTQEQITIYKRGRVGTCFFVAGMYLLALGATLLIPYTLDSLNNDYAYREPSADLDDRKTLKREEEKGKENDLWRPLAWKRVNFLLITIIFIVGLLITWEFSYSTLFTKHIYLFLVIFKLFRSAIETILRKVLHERLLVVPFLVVLAATELMIVTAASEFIQFAILYYFNLGLSLADRLYLAHLFQRLGVTLPRFVHKYVAKRHLDSKTSSDDEAEEANKESDQVDDENDLGIECIINGITGCCVASTELFIAPLMSAFQLVFYDDTKVAELYGVERTDLVYYVLFGIFIIPSHTIMGVFELNTMELLRGWKIYEYFSYMRHCFATRVKRWQLHHTKMDQNLHPTFQSLSLLCFSSQFYFLITVYSWGILLCVMSITIFLRADYSPFGDSITLLIVPLMVGVCWCIHHVSHIIGYRTNMWGLKGITVTLEDDVTTKLFVGGGRQYEQEQERLDLQAMKSEHFRHRFLQMNQPWILEHLKDMLTPRTIATADPEHKLSHDNIQKFYNDLIDMEKKHVRKSEISSDDENNFEKLRRNWSSTPVQGASKDVMLFWIAKARNRRSYGSVVATVLASNKQEICENCRSDASNERVLTNWLLDITGKCLNRNAMDELIDTFEVTYGSQESGSDLWKAYFRKEAKYMTLCDPCHNALEKDEFRSRLHMSGSSPDSNLHKNRFLPKLSHESGSNNSIEKKLILQWLLCARQRLSLPGNSNECWNGRSYDHTG